MPVIRPALTDLRATLVRRRALHSEERRLERELAEYRTSAERHELDAILSRHTAEEVAPVERIITRLHRGVAHQR